MTPTRSVGSRHSCRTRAAKLLGADEASREAQPLEGGVHRGTFDEGRASGRGILFAGNGSVFKGQWSANLRVGTSSSNA